MRELLANPGTQAAIYSMQLPLDVCKQSLNSTLQHILSESVVPSPSAAVAGVEGQDVMMTDADGDITNADVSAMGSSAPAAQELGRSIAYIAVAGIDGDVMKQIVVDTLGPEWLDKVRVADIAVLIDVCGASEMRHAV